MAAGIVEGVRAGRDEAKSELVERYSAGLFRRAPGKAIERDRAAGTVQETVTVALARRAEENLEFPVRLAAYLVGIARHRTSARFRCER